MKGMRSYTWMTFGIVLAVASKVFDQYNTKSVYQLFFYIGVLFFFIGMGKLVFEGGRSEKRKKPSKPHSTTITYCSACGTKNHSTSNYCHICGKKLGHRIG